MYSAGSVTAMCTDGVGGDGYSPSSNPLHNGGYGRLVCCCWGCWGCRMSCGSGGLIRDSSNQS
jgi:hypothetical protein